MKSYKEYLSYKTSRCKSNYKKQYSRLQTGEITMNEYCGNVNGYFPPLMDLYNDLTQIPHFPWKGSHSDMEHCILSSNVGNSYECPKVLHTLEHSWELYNLYKNRYGSKM